MQFVDEHDRTVVIDAAEFAWCAYGEEASSTPQLYLKDGTNFALRTTPEEMWAVVQGEKMAAGQGADLNVHDPACVPCVERAREENNTFLAQVLEAIESFLHAEEEALKNGKIVVAATFAAKGAQELTEDRLNYLAMLKGRIHRQRELRGWL